MQPFALHKSAGPHPQLHELRFQGRRRLVVLLPPFAQQPIHLVDEDDGRLQKRINTTSCRLDTHE